MIVFQDLLQYRDGIYETNHNFDELIGGHAVMILGYGLEDNIDYWYVRNSWGDDWGNDNGHFKIKIGDSYIA
jgi:cathepsin B